jgi:hypothetical protein
MKKRFTQLLFTSALLLLAFRGGAQIVNGTFDVNNPGSGWWCGNIYGWDRSDINGTNDDTQWEDQWNAGGDTWWVDLTGCAWGNDKWIEQTVATVPGNIYTLTFDLGCWNGQYYTTAGVDLSINGWVMAHYEHEDYTGSPLNWKKFTYCFVAYEKTTTIRFTGKASAPSWNPGLSPVSNYAGVIGLDNVDLKKADGQIILDHLCVPVDLTHNSGGGTAYWMLNGNIVGSGDQFHATVPGTYHLYYKTDCGTVEDEVTLEDCKDTCHMEPYFTATSINYQEPEIYCAGEYVIFEGFSGNGTALQYNWDFGSGPQGWTNSNTHYYIFDYPGVYQVCLTVWLKPFEVIPFCRPYTICRTIVVVDCTEQLTDPGDGTGDQPWPPGDPKSMLMEYPSLDVFPNPGTDLVTVQGLMTEDTDVMLSVYNIAGELVYEQPVAAGNTQATFSVKAFDAGVYLLKIKGKTYYKEVKLVKQ